jgi:enamine deaminase RidA (YjgF/YER057c/UK114 family)
VANLASALKAAGASLTEVLKTTIYVASGDRADLVARRDLLFRRSGHTVQNRPSLVARWANIPELSPCGGHWLVAWQASGCRRRQECG